jgi:hypothetical protein
MEAEPKGSEGRHSSDRGRIARDLSTCDQLRGRKGSLGKPAGYSGGFADIAQLSTTGRNLGRSLL